MDPIIYNNNNDNDNVISSSSVDNKIANVDVDDYIRKINIKRIEKRRSILEAKKTSKEKGDSIQHDNKELINQNTYNTTNEDKEEYITLKKKIYEKDQALIQVKEELKLLEIESRRLQLTVDTETNKKFLQDKQDAEKAMLIKSIEMDNDSEDIQKSLNDHIDSLKNEYNESLKELNSYTEKLKTSQENIEDLNVKYGLMKKTLLKTMDQYETLKDSFDDDVYENNEKNTLFCTLENLLAIPFIYNKSA